MDSKKIMGVLLGLAAVLSAILFAFPPVSTDCAGDDEAAHGGIDRVSGYDRMTRILRNDSEVRDLVEGGYIFKAGVFNETGESVAFISLPPLRQAASDSGPAARESIESYRVVTAVTDAGGETVGRESTVNTTGWENYKIILDIPNGTVSSVDRVGQLPEWMKQIDVTAVPRR
ncbi:MULTISPECIES: hypothetical protein [Methanoculleus]|uniref:Uncharacterized protein n=2 Tax=Methanoculleus TaxID=45989 RepID=A3CRT4_METMJ|nr:MULTISPECIES: hypothetical protein [Methanoculleus]ABN56084.1 hypothetical protein Memar_0149 [Methanoculleus marisnigri JR1]UYU17561.1 hypothetical protein OH143_07525 [Methanoculleus submarinus]